MVEHRNRKEILRYVDQYCSEFIKRFAALRNAGDIDRAKLLYSEWYRTMEKLAIEQGRIDQDAAKYILKVYRDTYARLYMNLRTVPDDETRDFSYRGELPRRRRIDHEFG